MLAAKVSYSPVTVVRNISAGPLVLLLGALVLIAFSPLLSWMVLVLTSIFWSPPYHRIRRVLGLSIVLCGSLCYASRETSGLTNDDFYYTYYPLYLIIEQDGLSAFLNQRYLEYGATIGVSIVELGFYVWLWGISLVFGKISIAMLIFLTTFVVALVYWFWLETYFLPEFRPARRTTVMALCLTLFSYGLCSQLSRQMFSIPFILMAIWDKRMIWGTFWLLVGALFHLTALPLVCFGWAVRRWPGICLGGLVGLLAVLFFWSPTLKTFGTVVAFDKIDYYSNPVSDEVAGFDSRYLLVALSTSVLGCLAIANRRFMLGHLLIASTLLYILLLPLPLASYRTTLFVTTALLGPALACGLVDRVGRRLFASICLGVALAMVARRAQLHEDGVGMSLWHKFPRADVVPFYYVPEIWKVSR